MVRDYRNVILVPAAAMVLGEFVGFLCPVFRPAVRRPRRWALVIFVLALGLLWLGRVHHWLGDLQGVDNEPRPPWWMLEAAEPLGALTFYAAMHAAAWLSIAYSTAIAAVTVLFGASAGNARPGTALFKTCSRALANGSPLPERERDRVRGMKYVSTHFQYRPLSCRLRHRPLGPTPFSVYAGT